MFNILYNEDIEIDMVNLFVYINQFTKSIGETSVVLDPSKCRLILLGMRQDLPHVDGMDRASCFKKIANFVVYFIAERPIQNPFSEKNIGGDLAKLSNHQNSIIALQIAIDGLHGATIYRNEKESLEIKTRIELSKHSYVDLIDSLQTATVQTHYKLLTILLEQLVYKTNPDCQYPVMRL
ncbi:MAG TPA: hypothetical protein ENI80_10075 [Acidiferrobacteraceae bacterium]|nr:hypothetical protein [Acidiferrobacteraceae bacterium]